MAPSNKEIVMNTQLSSKFVAIAAALAANTAMIGAVSILFSGQAHAHTVALAQISGVFGLVV